MEAGGGGPRAIVVTPTAAVADALARSLSRLARATGRRVRALGGAWALPERSDILFSSPDDLLRAIRDSRLSTDSVESLVVDGAGAVEALSDAGALEALFDAIPADTQRALFALPLTPELEELARRHLRKAVRLGAVPATGAPERGTIRVRVVPEERGDGILETVAGLLEAGAHHALVFFRNEDQAADVGDFLGLHGFPAGAPGDADAPVWIGTDELAARSAVQEISEPSLVSAVSYDVPSDADSLDRRHGAGAGGMVLALPRELPHVRRIAAEAGYRVEPSPEPLPDRLASELADFRARLATALQEEDLAPHLLVLEPLFASHAAHEVAAAAAALLRKAGRSAVAAPGQATPPPAAAPRGPAWVHLFVSLGTRDGIRPADLVGAITGEAEIDGSKVGKIEIRDTFSRVEVEESVAARVIRSLNGVTVKGRSVRVDYDRKESKRDDGRRGARPGPRQRRGKARGPRPDGSADG